MFSLITHKKEVAKSIKLTVGQDKLIFTLATSGICSSSLLYEDLRHKGNVCHWAKYIWNDFILTRIAFFIWKVVLNGISMDINIQQRGISLASKCPYCFYPNIESLEHLLFQGEVGSNIWVYFSKALNLTTC
ncbi:zf-RVT domain-containing protein [Cephalotus follicularis]|uniref:Zf-RVT domain-containing protein n=1 Tax=Cephalotus follicularis TaxID=3775 RepID=A0A1Q3ARN9_CEPFO|nr:zf-RVT domain-containing protein [Cephalotus follicularis]